MTNSANTERRHSNAYGIFVLCLTILSLFVMVGLLLPVSQPTRDALLTWDAVLCAIFVAEFLYNIAVTRPVRGYLIDKYGWLDLVGSVPAFLFPYALLLRLARVVRLVRIMRTLGAQQRRELLHDILRNRGQYAGVVTLLLVLVVLTTSSVLVLQFEVGSPDANITTGGDALWWSLVTITTVGYGDHYPVTALGRTLAAVVMFAGVGIIGALASILASVLVSPENGVEKDAPAEQSSTDVLQALAETRTELERTRAELADVRAAIAGLPVASAEAAPPPGHRGDV